MKLALIVVLPLGLAACSQSESASAVKQLQTVQAAHASPQEICTARRKVAAAYLKEGNTANYRGAKSDAETACLNADLSTQLAS